MRFGLMSHGKIQLLEHEGSPLSLLLIDLCAKAKPMGPGTAAFGNDYVLKNRCAGRTRITRTVPDRLSAYGRMFRRLGLKFILGKLLVLTASLASYASDIF